MTRWVRPMPTAARGDRFRPPRRQRLRARPARRRRRALDDRADLDAIVAIDHRLSGRDRRAYLRSRLEEALDDSTLRVSLAARRDGVLAGFLMARADHGDFGRTEPVAVLDTIGVDPAQTRQGVARALLTQLYANLAALRIERVETVVTAADDPLAAFLHASGFVPSQRLAFVRPMGNAA